MGSSRSQRGVAHEADTLYCWSHSLGGILSRIPDNKFLSSPRSTHTSVTVKVSSKCLNRDRLISQVASEFKAVMATDLGVGWV